MSSIDERIVKMTFDNKDFENGIKTSSDSLTKFKESLNKDASVTALQNISNTLSKMSFSNVVAGVENMSSKFSLFGVSAATVIQDVTRKIESMASTLATAVTTEPLTAGWSEYELKMNSVQTIMASTGEDISTVNQYLDELNQYADDTIYSFSDMTESIGKFTNSGVSLDDAVTAIKGISNEAAVSGANANEASRAMYNFAQALSTGYVALIDWKSIENANMATKEFKEQLLETAVACGTVEKTSDDMYQVLTENNSGSTMSDAINATDGFRDSLSYQWLTTEVLIETLKDYGDSTTEIGAKASAAATEVKTFSMMIDTLKEAMGSGWTETWETIFGDLETAKKGWTAVADALGEYIGNSADARNAKLSDAMSDPWDQLQQKFIAAGVSADDFESTMQELAISTGKVTEEMIEDAGGLENTLNKGWLSTDLLNSAIEKLGGTTESSVSDATESLSDYKDIVEDIIKGTYGNGSDRKSALEELGYDYEQLQAIVDAVWDGSEINWDNYTEEALIAAGATEEEAEALMNLKDNLDLTDEEMNQFVEDINSGKQGGTELLWESITNTIEGLSRILGSVKSAWTNVFGTIDSGDIYNIVSSIEKFTEKLLINQDTALNLQRTFRGLFSILSIIKTTVGTVLSRVFKGFSGVLGDLDIDILGTTGDIGLAIDKFRQWYESNDVVNKVIDAMIPSLKSAGTGIKNFAGKIKALPEVQAAITKLKEVFASLDDEIQNGFPGVQKWFEKLIEWIKSLKDLSFEDIKKSFKDLFTTIENGDVKFKFPTLSELAEKFPNVAEKISAAIDYLSGIFEKFSSITSEESALQDSADNVTSLFDVLSNAFSTIKTAIGTVVNSIDIGTLTSVAGVIVILVSIFKTISTVSKFAGVASAVTGLVKQLTNTMRSLSKGFANSNMSSKVDNIRSIVVSLTLLAAVIVILGKQPLSELIQGGIVVGAIAGGIIAIQAISGLLSKKGFSMGSGSLTGAAGTILAVAVAIKLIVSALEDLSSIDYTGFDVVEIVGLIGVLVLACEYLGTGNQVKGLVAFGQSASSVTKSYDGVATTLLAIAASLKLVVSALKDLTNLDYTVADVGLLAGMITALILACKALSKFGGSFSAGTALTLVAIPVALKLLVSAFEDLANLDLETIKAAIPALIAILIEMAAMMKISTIGGSKTKSGGATILAMAASIVLIAVAMKMLDSLDNPGQAIAAMVAIMACLTVFVTLANLTSKVAAQGSKISSGATTLLAAAVTIGVMAAAMVALSMIDEDKLKNAMAAILALAAAIAAMEVMSTFTGNSSAASLLAMAAVVAVLAASVGLLANLTDASALKNATNCLTQLMAVFSVVMVLSNFAKGSTESLATMAVLVAVIGVLALIIGALSNLTDASSLKTTCDALTEMVLSLSVMMVAMTALSVVGVAGIGTGLLGIVAALGTLALIAAAFGALNEYAPGVMTFMNSGMATFGTFIGSFIGGIISGVANVLDGNDALEGLASFVETLGPICETLGSIDTGITENVSNLASALLTLTGSELLDAIAGILGTDMEDFGTELEAFGDSMAAFAKSTEGISSDSLSGAIGAAQSLADLQSSLDSIGGVVDFFTGTKSWNNLSNGLSGLGTALKSFSDSVSLIDDKGNSFNGEAVKSAAEAATSLATLQSSLENIGGVVSWFGGDQSWDGFAKGLGTFGEALAAFSAALTGENSFNATAVSEAATASSGLVEVFNAMPSVSTLTNKLGGSGASDKWKTVKDGFSKFIDVLKEVAKTESIDTSSISSIETAIDDLVALKDAMPDQGFASTLKKRFNPTETTWEDVGGYIKDFVDMLNSISSNTSDFKTTNFTKLSNSASKISSLKTAVPFGTAKDLEDSFDPDQTTWEKVGTAINSFVDMLNGISTISASSSNIDSIATAADSLKTLKGSMPKASGWSEKLGDDSAGTGWGAVKTGLESFGEALTAFSDCAANLDSTAMDTAIAELTSLSELDDIDFGTTGSDAITSIVSGMQEATETVSETVTEVASSLVEALTTAIDTDIFDSTETMSSYLVTAITTMITAGSNSIETTDYESAGEDLADSVASGINSNAANVSTAASTAASNGAASVKNYRSSFYSAGSYLIDGLANGILNNKYKAVNAAVKVASDTLTALNEALDEHSPSKETEQSGKYFDLGFANGIKKLAGKVEEESESVGTIALSALSGVADGINAALDDDLQFTPSITPVMDLSDVASGAQQINGMLGRSYGLNIDTARIDTLSSAMNQIQNGSGNDDVVAAIRKLNKTMSSDRQNVYNVGGVTYDDGSNVASAVRQLVRVANIERRA